MTSLQQNSELGGTTFKGPLRRRLPRFSFWVQCIGRPHVDTLKASGHGNMKELRLSVGDGEWRIAFAFDPRRHAILLVGASKSGVTSDRFYRRLIAVADARLSAHLAELRKGKRR